MIHPTSEPKFLKPKILLIDLPDAARANLVSAGYNVKIGTFGRPYWVQLSAKWFPVIADPLLPNYTEQEVVIIDLTAPEMADRPTGRRKVPDGEFDWYGKANRGVIDPRSRSMCELRSQWDRLLEHGAVFVVFAQARLEQELVLGKLEDERLTTLPLPPLVDNWSFLSILSQWTFNVKSDHGLETKVLPSFDFVESFLHSHQAEMEFEAVLSPKFPRTNELTDFEYRSLIESKFGNSVGGIIFAKKPKMGRILILPQIKDKARAVKELITTILPEFCRQLFPDFVGGRWVHSSEYEHPTVLELKQNQNRIREEADARIEALDRKIELEQEQCGFLHSLLTKTGDELVAAVRKTLEIIGFEHVKTPEEEEGTNKQEDLQVHDRSPCLLMEVKGLAGMPTEGDSLQVTKYVMRRIKQWKPADVSGVFLVNHQRNIPALERDHNNVFTQQQLGDSVANGMGLMTSWDLFRLVRGMIRWKWPRKVVQDVFYGKGRLPSVPSHYVVAGIVKHFYSELSVLVVEVRNVGMRIGGTVGFILSTGFEEEAITSLQVDRKDVKEACPGQQAGFKTTFKRKDIPVGTPIYVLTDSTEMN